MRKILFLLLLSIVLLSGCTNPSGEKAFPTMTKGNPQQTGKPMDPTEASKWILHAVEAANTKKAVRFSFNGYIANNIQKRRITNMYNGVIIRPDTLYVNATLIGQPYGYLRKKGQSYFFDGKKWAKAPAEMEPLDPMKGFTDWIPFADRAVQLKEENILSIPCVPIQIKVSGEEWMKGNANPLFNDIRQMVANRPDMATLLKDTEVETTLWFGKKDHLVYQYRTYIRMPIPSGEYMDQEIFFRFIKYNDPGITVPNV